MKERNHPGKEPNIVHHKDGNEGIDIRNYTKVDGVDKKRWMSMKRNIIGLAMFAGSGAFLLSNPQNIGKIKDQIVQKADIEYAIFPFTEGLAWLGAGIMLGSAGKKIGNPLTVKKRLSEVRNELNDNSTYRIGWVLGAVGAVGTSAAIAVGAVATLPIDSWPFAFSISATSLAFSTIPFKPTKNNEMNLEIPNDNQ